MKSEQMKADGLTVDSNNLPDNKTSHEHMHMMENK